MPITSRDLITKSYYLSGIVGRDYQTVPGQYIEDGLDLLNDILVFKTVDDRKIPYYTSYDFTTVPGQEMYFIPDLIQQETLTYLINGVRIPVKQLERQQYFNMPRFNTMQGYPSIYHPEKTKGGVNIYMYFIPNSNYDFTLFGNFRLSEVTLDQDLEPTLEKFYIEYLRYVLASYLCDFFNHSIPVNVAKRLAEYESLMVDTSPMDLSIIKTSTLQRRNLPNADLWWPMIGIGFVP